MRAMSAAARYCTTRQLNAHGTGVERKLCYPWHPWAGLKVHVYTSPHLVRFNERIRLAGTLITDDALNAILDRVEAAMAQTGGQATLNLQVPLYQGGSEYATVRAARGRGYGAALSVAALTGAREAGAHGAVLHASPDGLGIYERLGFRTVAAVHTVVTSD